MKKIKFIQVQQQNGLYSQDIPIGVDAQNVQIQSDQSTNTDTNLASKLEDIDNDISSLGNQIAQHIASPNNTGGDVGTELRDIRNAADGSTTYASAGRAVRQQIKLITRAKPYINDEDLLQIKNYKIYGGQGLENQLTLDASLSVSGAAADSKAVGDEIADFKNDFNDSIGGEQQKKINFVYGTWINTGNAVEIGDTVDISNLAEWFSLKHAIVECQQGDKFLLNITGATNARAYAFLTSNNVLISRSNANEEISDYIIAPQNAGKVIIQGVYRQSSDDTVTNEGTAYQIISKPGNVVRFDFSQNKTENEKATARANIGVDTLLTQKLDKQQAISDAGKMLVIGNDGIITSESKPSPGLSEAVKTALLNCFNNVTWENGQKDTLIAALQNALNNET